MKKTLFTKGPSLAVVLNEGRISFEPAPQFVAIGPFESHMLEWLERYGHKAPSPPPLLPFDGLTPFTKKVLLALAQIPFGQTLSYCTLAGLLKSAPRPIGGACGRNPYPLFIPCHRVLAHDGSIGGFSAGLPFKKILLDFESN